jgi:uncharacterized protein YdhG (YjbR/CyaY superfamily)
MSKLQKEISTIDEYIGNFQPDIREILRNIRQTIHESAPDAKETINYGIPTFKLRNKNLVHFAAYKTHIGFYPTPSGINAFKKELEEFEYSKGTVRFPLGKPIPYTLIKKIVKYRLRELSV